MIGAARPAGHLDPADSKTRTYTRASKATSVTGGYFTVCLAIACMVVYSRYMRKIDVSKSSSSVKYGSKCEYSERIYNVLLCYKSVVHINMRYSRVLGCYKTPESNAPKV